MKMPYLLLKTIKLEASLQNLFVTRKFEKGLGTFQSSTESSAAVQATLQFPQVTLQKIRMQL